MTLSEVGPAPARRLIAVKRAKELGTQLAQTRPNLADRFRAGESHVQIGRSLEELADFSVDVQRVAVQTAMRILIPDADEREALWRAHVVETNRRMIHQRVGIYGLGQADRRAAGNLAALANGKMPWEDERRDPITGLLSEAKFCLLLAADPNYQRSKPPYLGKPDAAKIAARLNDVFHEGKEVRDAAAVRSQMHRTRKQISTVTSA